MIIMCKQEALPYQTSAQHWVSYQCDPEEQTLLLKWPLFPDVAGELLPACNHLIFSRYSLTDEKYATSDSCREWLTDKIPACVLYISLPVRLCLVFTGTALWLGNRFRGQRCGAETHTNIREDLFWCGAGLLLLCTCVQDLKQHAKLGVINEHFISMK